MAQPVTLLKDFAGGQGGGASNYVTYADDLDTNFADLETTVNQLVAESTAILASNALLPQDLLQANDPARAGGVLLDGVIGGHSYEVSINGGDASLLDVAVGSALLSNRRVELTSGVQLAGSGLGGSPVTAYVNIDTNGVPGLSATQDNAAMDIVTVSWNGTIFTAITSQDAPIFLDGDDYADMLSRSAIGAGPVLAAKDFRKFADRQRTIERLLGGQTTDGDGDSIGPVELNRLFASDNGTASLPWMSRQSDPNTGIYFIAADRLGLSTGGTLALEVSADQHIDSPTQPRFDVRRQATQSIASGTSLVVIDFDAEITDIGSWGTATSGPWTVPTGADGFYIITGGINFAADSTGQRELAVTLNGAGTVLLDGGGHTRVDAAAAGDTFLNVSATLALAAGDVLRLECAQDSGGNLNINARFGACKLW